MARASSLKLRELVHGEAPTVPPEESASAAFERMKALGVDHLVVLKGEKIAGILSRRDLDGPSGGAHRRMGRRVADLMRRDVVTVSAASGARAAAALMRRHGIGCLPVLDKGRLVGLLTVSDLLALLERQLAR